MTGPLTGLWHPWEHGKQYGCRYEGHTERAPPSRVAGRVRYTVDDTRLASDGLSPQRLRTHREKAEEVASHQREAGHKPSVLLGSDLDRVYLGLALRDGFKHCTYLVAEQQEADAAALDHSRSDDDPKARAPDEEGRR